jgi:hypothetical protein
VLEYKEKEHETTKFFPVVSRSWRSSLVDVGALTKSVAPPQATKIWVLTKSGPFSISETVGLN